mmetsp:Transcript_22927/g.47547  ORF Transcript_22927/g.47547 Transcript_22927/m.47547 type:complete len:200 (+) Transcript_22927:180-779(+)
MKAINDIVNAAALSIILLSCTANAFITPINLFHSTFPTTFPTTTTLSTAIHVLRSTNEDFRSEEEMSDVPFLSPLHIKILRKETTKRRKTKTLPTHFLQNSATSIDPTSLMELDSLLNENELVECRSILLECIPAQVTDGVYSISSTLSVPCVSRKGHAAVFYRPFIAGGIVLRDSNNADGMQFVKKVKRERDSRGRPI